MFMVMCVEFEDVSDGRVLMSGILIEVDVGEVMVWV